VNRAGYFRQKTDEQRGLVEYLDFWDTSRCTVPLGAKIAVTIEDRDCIDPELVLHPERAYEWSNPDHPAGCGSPRKPKK